jgi:hypothetical protein
MPVLTNDEVRAKARERFETDPIFRVRVESAMRIIDDDDPDEAVVAISMFIATYDLVVPPFTSGQAMSMGAPLTSPVRLSRAEFLAKVAQIKPDKGVLDDINRPRPPVEDGLPTGDSDRPVGG